MSRNLGIYSDTQVQLKLGFPTFEHHAIAVIDNEIITRPILEPHVSEAEIT